MIAASLTGYGKDEKPQENSQQGTNQSTEQSDESQSGQQTDQESSDPGQKDPGLAQGTSFNSIDDYKFEAPQEGVWQYYFSGDNGETFDKCTTYDDYPDSKVRGWHPWTDSYIGVGFNDDMEGFLELNTPGNGAEIMALGFRAPAEGTYTFSGYTFNPYSQSCEAFHLSLNGEEKASVDIADYTAKPNEFTVEIAMAEGDVFYFYCPSTTADSWVSAYLSVFVNAQ